MALPERHSIQEIVSRDAENTGLNAVQKNWLKFIAGVVAGAVLGYAYYHFIGCRSGTCPLTSNPWVTTLYGTLMGGILTFPSRAKRGRRGQ